MKQRTLGADGPQVSAIGYGAMVLSPGMYGHADEATSIETLHFAIDSGVTLIDTAHAYGGGHNEEIVGRALRGRRQQVTLATKGGLSFETGAPILDGRPETLRRQLEVSLKRLATSHVDLYYLHNGDPSVPIEDSVGEMARFVGEGKARYLGVSNLALDDIRRARSVHPIHASQDEYSLFNRKADREHRVEQLRSLGIGLVAYCPLGQGVIAGALRDGGFSPGDYRSRSPRFRGDEAARLGELSQRFHAMAAEADLPPATLALAWLLHRGDHVVPIPGTRKREHVRADLAAAEVTLARELLDRLEEAFPSTSSMGDAW
jgi:aryl-alcohol dehydrogenase-like predicted oxidoreductase